MNKPDLSQIRRIAMQIGIVINTGEDSEAPTVRQLVKFARAFFYVGVALGREQQRNFETTEMRNARFVDEYKSGKTLQQIGAAADPPISRERVRQILLKAGVDPEDGGVHLRSFVRQSNLRRTRTPHADKFSHVYGCSLNDARLINGDNRLTRRGCIAFIYNTQRLNALRLHIEWKMTFPEWWKIWCDSGKWFERGRGTGYLMLRIGGCGAFEPDNVEIVQNAEAQSERMAMYHATKRSKQHEQY